eukprot:TRINITY_DN20617_c0_g1_i1.p1 TRINITY_DN20617_c0_g1~~TRINITY_DN20617_c0_g1_i1.p1  ORF type:complete len:533 (-),score=87.46 TRINITY_DN20617_c0_g1_i1:347-1945(-)
MCNAFMKLWTLFAIVHKATATQRSTEHCEAPAISDGLMQLAKSDGLMQLVKRRDYSEWSDLSKVTGELPSPRLTSFIAQGKGSRKRKGKGKGAGSKGKKTPPLPQQQLINYLHFGGLKHTDNSSYDVQYRPEYTTTERFNESLGAWETCSSEEKSETCFRGTNGNRCIDTNSAHGQVTTDVIGHSCSDYAAHPSLCEAFDDSDFSSKSMCCDCGGGGDINEERFIWAWEPSLEGHIPAGSDVSTLALEMHVDCPVDLSIAAFALKVFELSEGIVHIFHNLQKLATVDESGTQSHRGDLYRTSGDGAVIIPVLPDSKNTLRVEFSPTKGDTTARVRLDIYGTNIPEDFDHCMGLDHCMKVLDASSAEAKMLRNDHFLQVECLEGRSASQYCAAWRDCLTKANRNSAIPQIEDHLLQVLRATLVPTGHEGKAVIKDDHDHAECISPLSADPESWDCDCIDNFNKRCDDMGMARDQVCYKLLLCDSPVVCPAWKDAACEKQGSALLALQQRRLAHAGAAQGLSMEASLSAKACAR